MWKETSGGTFSVLHAFSNSTDGEDPAIYNWSHQIPDTGPCVLAKLCQHICGIL
ncbi:MAG: hypothetical protein JWQ87_4781 [Candidatus Sulfotelmatobacter sp.]|nr:hypothetical protein [Candidatus Sulfotelmatobacter sp.]